MIVTLIIIGVVLVYALGRSDGRDKLKDEIRDTFGGRRGRK